VEVSRQPPGNTERVATQDAPVKGLSPDALSFFTTSSEIVDHGPIVVNITIVLKNLIVCSLGVISAAKNADRPTPRAVHVIGESGVATTVLHPLRLEILSKLSEPDSAAGLALRMGMPRQHVNCHIRRLEEQGLVNVVGERRVINFLKRLVQAVGRSCVISPADPDRIEDAASTAYLVAVLSQMVQEVTALQHKPGQPDMVGRTPALRADVRFRSRKAQNEFATELGEEVARPVAKYHVPRASKGRLLRILASAHPVPTYK
jgi:DNA-binding transcriptional ArsR family regulator